MFSEAQFNLFILAWVSLAIVVFVILMFINAPYGRHLRDGWGINIPARLGWITMESPTIIVMTLYLYYYYVVLGRSELVGALFYLIWTSHYFHRTFVWPFRAQINKKKMPLSIALFAIFFNTINASINAESIFKVHASYSTHWITSPQFICGVFLFIIGMYINISSDNILIKIRKQSPDDYVIPKNGLYSWVSSPNYFGEILEWIGWAIATWSLAGFSFAFWVIANLVPRARSNHHWYLENFEDYPKNRKKLIPGVW